jgi:O-antigen/teichoic acid export membrane protein
VKHRHRKDAGGSDAGSAHPSLKDESLSRSAAFALGVQLTTAAFTAVLQLYLVRALGPTAYGVFALALATGGLVVVPADLGISAATSRFVAERRGERAAVAEVIAAGFRLKLITAVAIAGVLFAASGPIAAAYDTDALVWPLRGAALALFGQTIMLFFQRTFIAQARIAPNLRSQIVESSVETTASIALVALGAGATGAAFGRAAGYLVGAAFALALTVRLVGRPAVKVSRRSGASGRDIIRYAGPLTIVDGAYMVFSQIDAVLIGLLLTPADVGLFQAPVRFITFLSYPGLALANAVSPRVARRGHGTTDPRPLAATLRLMIIVQALLVAPLLVWPGPIVHVLLGDGYGESATVLQALTPYVFLTGVSPIVSMAMNYVGEAKRRVPIVLGTVLLNVVIDLVLIPRIGIVAGAIGTDVAYTFYVLAHFWICRTELDLQLRLIVRTLVRAGVAAAAMAGVLLLIGTSGISLTEWLVGGIGGCLAFGGALVATREISPADLRLAGTFAWRQFPRRAGA